MKKKKQHEHVCLENRTARRDEEQTWAAGKTLKFPNPVFLQSFYLRHTPTVSFALSREETEGRLYPGDL